MFRPRVAARADTTGDREIVAEPPATVRPERIEAEETAEEPMPNDEQSALATERELRGLSARATPLRDPGRLALRVIDETLGADLDELTLRLRSEKRFVERTESSPIELGLTAGAWEGTIRHAGYDVAQIEEIVVESGVTLDLGTFVLRRGIGVVGGRVTSSAAPVASFDVELYGSGRSPCRTCPDRRPETNDERCSTAPKDSGDKARADVQRRVFHSLWPSLYPEDFESVRLPASRLGADLYRVQRLAPEADQVIASSGPFFSSVVELDDDRVDGATVKLQLYDCCGAESALVSTVTGQSSQVTCTDCHAPRPRPLQEVIRSADDEGKAPYGVRGTKPTRPPA